MWILRKFRFSGWIFCGIFSDRTKEVRSEYETLPSSIAFISRVKNNSEVTISDFVTEK